MTCTCACVAMCAAIVRLDAAAAAYTPLVLLARVAHNSLRPVCLTGAGQRAATAPPLRAVLCALWRPPGSRDGRGTSARPAGRAGGFDAMADTAGVIAAALAATSSYRPQRSLERGERHARAEMDAHVCVWRV